MKTRLSIIKEQVENMLEAILVGPAAAAAVAKPAPAGIRMSEAEKKAEEDKKRRRLGSKRARFIQQGLGGEGEETKTVHGGEVTSNALLASKKGAGGEVRTFNPDLPGDRGIGRKSHAGRAHTMPATTEDIPVSDPLEDVAAYFRDTVAGKNMAAASKRSIPGLGRAAIPARFGTR